MYVELSLHDAYVFSSRCTHGALEHALLAIGSRHKEAMGHSL